LASKFLVGLVNNRAGPLRLCAQLGFPLVIAFVQLVELAAASRTTRKSLLTPSPGAGYESSAYEDAVERSPWLAGKEYEREVMRDFSRQLVVICTTRIDPHGRATAIRYGAPAQKTLDRQRIPAMRDGARPSSAAVGVENRSVNVQSDTTRKWQDGVWIEMNPPVSRQLTRWPAKPPGSNSENRGTDASACPSTENYQRHHRKKLLHASADHDYVVVKITVAVREIPRADIISAHK